MDADEHDLNSDAQALRRSPAPSFARALLTSVVGLVAILGLSLLIVMVWQNTTNTEEGARQEIGETLSRTTGRLQILIRAAEMVAESAERLVHTTGVTGSTLRPALENLLPAFEQRPELSYLGIVLPETGEYGNLKRTATGDIHLRLLPGTRVTDPVVRTLRLTPRGFEASESYPTDGYDARNRPFYKAAIEAEASGTWVLAYPWVSNVPEDFGSSNEELWGVSYVKALRDEAGMLKGVLDTDFDLPALNAFLASLSEEYSAQIHIVELGPIPRLIGAPSVGQSPLAVPEEFTALLSRPGSADTVERTEHSGERRWVATRRIELLGGLTWLVVVSRSAPLIEASLRDQLWQVLATGLVILLGLVLVSIRVAGRFGRPLAELKRSVARIENALPELPEPFKPPAATQGFRETQLLGNAIDRMAIAVRQQVRMKEQLAASAALKAAIFDSTSTVIFSLDRELNVVEWNTSAERVFGKNRKDVLGRGVEMFVAAPHGPVDWAEIRQKQRVECLTLLGSSGAFDAELRIVAIETEGTQIHTVVLTDISEHTRIEQSLRQERDYAEAVINSLPGIFYYIDQRSRLVRWNENLERFSGYSHEELLDADPLAFFPIEERARVKNCFRECLETGEISFEADYILKDGSRIPYLFTGVRFEYNGSWGVVGTGTDIAERKQTQLQLLAFNAELEQRVAYRTAELQSINQELEAFCHSVAHDLRTPLRSIAGYAALLAQEHFGGLDIEGQEYLNRVQAATRRMGELITDLLMLSRISREEMYREPVNLSAIANEILADLQQNEPGRNVEVFVEGEVVADGDARLLKIAMENLLGNAWKFTSKNPNAKIQFASTYGDVNGVQSKPPSYVVSDNGAGFDMEFASKLFGAFQRLHANADFPGTGIGLAIVHRIISRHGGHIHARAEPGRGATFIFSTAPKVD